jgi:hypothetical protein
MAMDLFAQKVKKQNKQRKRRLISSLFGARIKPSIASKRYLDRYVVLSSLQDELVSATKRIRSIDSRIRRAGSSKGLQGNESEDAQLRQRLEFWLKMHADILFEIKRAAEKGQ